MIAMLEYLPENVSKLGAEHDKLFELVWYISVLIFFLVNIVFVYFIIRYRYKENRKAHYYHGNNLLEFTWTLLPTILFIGLGLYSDDLWAQWKYQDRAPKADVEIDCLGQAFMWHFRYPGADGVLGRRSIKLMTPSNPFGVDPDDPASRDDITLVNEFNLPINKQIVVHLSSVDVLHSFFLPNFRQKQDAVPGMWFDVWFEGNRSGVFELACAELCGSNHYAMRGVLNMQSEEDFNAWMNEKIEAKLAQISPSESNDAAAPEAGDEDTEDSDTETTEESIAGEEATSNH